MDALWEGGYCEGQWDESSDRYCEIENGQLWHWESLWFELLVYKQTNFQLGWAVIFFFNLSILFIYLSFVIRVAIYQLNQICFVSEIKFVYSYNLSELIAEI